MVVVVQVETCRLEPFPGKRDGETVDKLVVYFRGQKSGLVIGPVLWDAIAAIMENSGVDKFSADDYAFWPGHWLELHRDRTQFGGKLVPCIRARVPITIPSPKAKAKTKRNRTSTIRLTTPNNEQKGRWRRHPPRPKFLGSVAMSRLIHEPTIRKFLKLIHSRAAAALSHLRRPGVLQAVSISPDDRGLSYSAFAIGDVDRMFEAVLIDAKAGRNTYIETRTVRPGRPKERKSGRGTADATLGTFAIVVDSDGDRDRAAHIDCGATIVETSPGN
jgi:hypothetical protein